MRAARLTPKEKRDIRRMFREGVRPLEIIERTGKTKAQVYSVTKKTKAKKAKAELSDDGYSVDGPDYKKLYYKALALLIEHRVIEVELQ